MTQRTKLTIIPCDLDKANEFIALHHRHHHPVRGYKFALAVVDEQGKVRGVATVGRPVARHLDDGLTLEINRLCTDGCPNACSILYAAAARAAKAMGYRIMVTYTLPDEGGASLKAVGWQNAGEAGGGSWDTPTSNRPRNDRHPLERKWRWEVRLSSESLPDIHWPEKEEAQVRLL